MPVSNLLKRSAKRLLPQGFLRKLKKLRGPRSPDPLFLETWDGRSAKDQAKKFVVARAASERIDGMLSPFSMAVMDSILSFQIAFGRGHIVEFGTYKGRSAAILAHHVQTDEKLILVDIADYLEMDVIKAIAPQMEFELCSSEQFPDQHSGFRSLSKGCRLIHVDSSHSYRTTLRELDLCDRLLSKSGVAVFDDYTNLNYSQILPAIYKYLYTTDCDLAVFLVTDIKAYLCRRNYLNYYLSFVLNGLVPSMTARGVADVMISRTDWDIEYRAIYLRTRDAGETGSRYGEEIYGHLYEGP
jgi:cephalosporin hydroxylase